ncbi:MAG TPA: glycosyltransferase family 2 protein, partial [Acidimicrobiia bacterium]|nr:glycosyltransferase family 2 protein [Acidimicrobiia bacterium]
IVEPTLVGCRAMTLPHRTYLLDDGRRPEMRELAAKYGAIWVTRPDNAHAKAGNINHALTRTDGELVVVLDADHVPRPDFLEATLGYFDDPEVALVQTPHDFFNRDSIQHTSTVRHEQTLFFDVIGPGKDRCNSMIWCGSATVIRRTALESVGGVLTDTVAEDFHTTIRMHAQGWRTRYHDEILVQGRAPHDLASFLLQRARWARGNLAVFRTRENPVTCPGLTLRQRVSYFASLYNYFSGLQRIALLLVLTWVLLTGQLPMHASPLTLVTLWLPFTLLAVTATMALGRGSLGAFDSTRFGIMTAGIYIRGVLSLFSRRTGKFKVTPKEGVDSGGLPVLRMLGLVTTVAALLLAAWILRVAAWAGLVSLGTMPLFARTITVGLGVWELGCLAGVLVPLVRRRRYRVQYRMPTRLQARIDRTSTVVPVLDLTPGGISFESPIALDTRAVLLTRLPDAQGEIHDLTLPAEVRWCTPTADGSRYRVGCRFEALDPAVRELLVEYCFVVQPALQLGAELEPARPARVLWRAERAG